MAETVEIFVRDYMTPNPTTLGPDDALLQALLAIRSLSIRHIPVVKDGKLVGLITDRTIARVSPSILSTSQEEYNQVFEQTPISRVMLKKVTTVTPATPLKEVVQLLLENKWGCVPVVEDEAVVGIITVIDILRYTMSVLNPDSGSITL